MLRRILNARMQPSVADPATLQIAGSRHSTARFASSTCAARGRALEVCRNWQKLSISYCSFPLRVIHSSPPFVPQQLWQNDLEFALEAPCRAGHHLISLRRSNNLCRVAVVDRTAYRDNWAAARGVSWVPSQGAAGQQRTSRRDVWRYSENKNLLYLLVVALEQLRNGLLRVLLLAGTKYCSNSRKCWSAKR